MKKNTTLFTRIRNIRRLGIKTAISTVSTIAVVSVFYPFILENFYLTERHADWNTNKFYTLGFGFVLAVTAYKYNAIADKLIEKFGGKIITNESNNDK